MTLSDPSNGQLVLNGLGLQSTANYTCDSGYSLVGSTSRVYQADGKWSGSVSCKCMYGTVCFNVDAYLAIKILILN